MCSLNSATTSSEGQRKNVGGVEVCSEVPFVLKECNYINWNTLELDIWIPDHYIDTSDFTLRSKKYQTYVFFYPQMTPKTLIICEDYSKNVDLEKIDEEV